MATPAEQTRQARRDARVVVEQARRERETAMAQEAVPAILRMLLMHTVRLCDQCLTEHFTPKPENPNRDCLNVRCECWCTTRREQ